MLTKLKKIQVCAKLTIEQQLIWQGHF